MQEIFKKHDDEYLKFDRVKNKKSKRKDVHAFILLSEVFEDNSDILSGTGHDIVYLNIEGEQINKLTEEQIVELIRCGIMFEDAYDCLSMFI